MERQIQAIIVIHELLDVRQEHHMFICKAQQTKSKQTNKHTNKQTNKQTNKSRKGALKEYQKDIQPYYVGCRLNIIVFVSILTYCIIIVVDIVLACFSCYKTNLKFSEFTKYSAIFQQYMYFCQLCFSSLSRSTKFVLFVRYFK